jgi:hypothetical protein
MLEIAAYFDNSLATFTTLLNSFTDGFITSVWGTQTVGNIFTDNLADRIRPLE